MFCRLHFRVHAAWTSSAGIANAILHGSEDLMPKICWTESHAVSGLWVMPRLSRAPALMAIAVAFASVGQAGFAQTASVCPTIDTATPDFSPSAIHSEEISGGIRLKDYEPDINIRFKTPISVSCENSDGIHISYSNTATARKNRQTKIDVRDVTLNSTTEFELGAINVSVPGNLIIKSDGKISTTGDYMHGVLAKLYGGPNDKSENNGMQIEVNDLTTDGDNAYGILTHSHDAQNRKHSVIINGIVSTDGNGSHGVASSGRFANVRVKVNKAGSITIVDPGPSESKAIYILNSQTDMIAKAQIRNAGKIDGRIYAEACSEGPMLVNRGSVYSMNSESSESNDKAIELIKSTSSAAGPCNTTAGKGTFSNKDGGIFSPGGPNKIAEATVRGNFEQQDDATIQVDVDWRKATADRIVIEGSTELAGQIDILEMSSPLLGKSGSKVEVIHGKTGLSIKNPLEILGVTDRILINYRTQKRTVEDKPEEFLDIIASYDLQHPDLNQNQINVLTELHRSRNDKHFEDVIVELGRETEIESLRYDLDSFGNEIAGTVLQTSALANLDFASSLQDCGRVPGSSFIGDANESSGKCIWVAPELQRHIRRRTFPQRGYSDNSVSFATGATLFPEDLGVRFDLAVGFDDDRTAMQDFAFADGHRWHLASGVGAEIGAIDLSLVASASKSNHKIRRRLPDLAGNTQATGTQKTRTVGALATISGDIELGGWSVSPSLEAGVLRINGSAYSESGDPKLSLDVDAVEKTVSFLRPALAVKIAKTTLADLNVAPQLGFSVTHSNNRYFTINNRFKGGLGSFGSTTSLLGSEFGVSVGANIHSESQKFFGHAGLSISFAHAGVSSLKVGGGSFMFLF